MTMQFTFGLGRRRTLALQELPPYGIVLEYFGCDLPEPSIIEILKTMHADLISPDGSIQG